jgi:hypothetical protein
LPTELSSLVGRDPEIAAALERLSTARVVTLTGPGGCGKTRLALRVAALAEPGFEDGARLVELAPLTDPTLVPASGAEALGVPERDATDPIAAIVRALADRELLIVLDNCEHVLGSAGRVVVALAGQCPGVRILATSRERLDVPGESVFPVPPLGLPEDGSAGAVAASEAGTLFVARARAASPRGPAGPWQRGRDRRGVRPAGRDAAGHRAGRGPVPGAWARAAGSPSGGPPGAAGRQRGPPGTAPLPGGAGVLEL